jgi:surface protein
MPFAAHSLMSAQHVGLRRLGRQQSVRLPTLTVGAIVNNQPSTVVLNIPGLTLGILTSAEKDRFKNELAALLGISSDLITLTFAAGSLILNMGIDGNKVDSITDKLFVTNTQAILYQLSDSDITSVIQKSNTQAAITGQPSIAMSQIAINIDPDLLDETIASETRHAVLNPVVGDTPNSCMYTLISQRIVRIDKSGLIGKICNFPESLVRYIFLTADSKFLVIPTNVFSTDNVNGIGQTNLVYSAPHANTIYVVHILSGAVFVNRTAVDFNSGIGMGFNPFNNTLYYSSAYASSYNNCFISTISFSDSSIPSTPGPSVLNSRSAISFLDIDNGFISINGAVYMIRINTNTATRIAGPSDANRIGGWTNTPQGEQNIWGTANGGVYSPFKDAPVGTDAWFTFITSNGTVIDRLNNRLLILDTYAQRLRSIDLSDTNYQVSTIAGTSPVNYGSAKNLAGGTLSSSVLSSLGQVGLWENGTNSMPPYEKVNSTYLTSTFNNPSNITIFGNSIFITEYNGTRLLANGYVSDFTVLGDINQRYNPIPDSSRYMFTISADHPEFVTLTSLDLDKVSSISWGDGVRDERPTSITHRYTTPGPHTINIRGTFTRVPSSTSFTPYITDVSHYAGLTDMSSMFYGARTFNQDISNWDTSKVTSMAKMFESTGMFNQPIGAWDTSNVTDMSYMFFTANKFDQPIGAWDTSNVTDMTYMFSKTLFNQPIGGWDTSNVTAMPGMFSNAVQFNQSIGAWDTSKVTNMNYMFWNVPLFNQPIGAWDTSKVTDMASMFERTAIFNQPIGDWDTSKVTNMRSMFENATAFNEPIGDWDTSEVTNMAGMFTRANAFNQPIGTWNTSKVTDMTYMFFNARVFNQPIGNWNTSNVTNMTYMFGNSRFNQPIGGWDTSNVTDMKGMFQDTGAFNQPIGDWDTSKVTNMSFMFYNLPLFNQPIGAWDTSKVTNMSFMFFDARAFNQPIGNWNTGSVNTMRYMFYNATAFNQPIGDWDTSSVTDMQYMFATDIFLTQPSAFDQPIGNWDTRNVRDMTKMFGNASAFNQNISSWNLGSVNNLVQMFIGVPGYNITPSNYTNITNKAFTLGQSLR